MRGVGPAGAQALEDELGIGTIEDLLMHLPRAFEEVPPPTPVDRLAEGEQATVLVSVGTVGRFQPSGARGRRSSARRGRLEVTVADVAGRGATRAVWFNQPWLADDLKPSDRLRLVGRLERHGFVVADHERLDADSTDPDRDPGLLELGWRSEAGAPAAIHLRRPVPLHPASERLKPRQLRRLVWRALSRAEHLPEPLPARLRTRLGLPGQAEALRVAHFPALATDGQNAAEVARRRLALAELAMHRLALNRRRADRRSQRGEALAPGGETSTRWRASLPFQLTGDQERAIDEIAADLGTGRPMTRLLMGEVGSGKTVVAVAAMLQALDAGRQAAIMAPTEVLAEQHAATIQGLLGGSHEVGLLTGSTPAAARRELLGKLASGDIGMVVGTHALLEDEVRFNDLVLCVVDEQHRFGVRQRTSLDAKARSGTVPHRLHMSATPIPRTLALLGYGDLDLSELRELPAGRQPVETRLVEAGGRDEEFGRLRESLRAGRQAYVICPLVSESEALQAKAAVAEAQRLAAEELAGFRIAVLHGRLAAAEKRAVMAGFAAGDADVLVATTVVEVGVDVPNATWIVIEGAERFGLSQLHQLRGRVGRGEHRSSCLLVPGELTFRSRQRLSAVAAENDGFRLAELDLEMRGAGEILGSRQHGLPGFRAARFPEDGDLLEVSGEVAAEISVGLDGEDPGARLFSALAESQFGNVSERGIAA